MCWPLYVDRTIVIRKRIRSSLNSVSEIVLDGESYLRLQPFVTKITQDGSNPRLYRVTERVPAPFGLWKMNNSFQVTFSPMEDQEGRGFDYSGQFDLSFLAPKFESSVRARDTGEAGVIEVIEVMKARVCSNVVCS
jgi:hypothetical protein